MVGVLGLSDLSQFKLLCGGNVCGDAEGALLRDGGQKSFACIYFFLVFFSSYACYKFFVRIIVIHKGRILVVALVGYLLQGKVVGHNLLLNFLCALLSLDITCFVMHFYNHYLHSAIGKS